MGLFPLWLAYTGIGLCKLLKTTSPSYPVMDTPWWTQNAFTLDLKMNDLSASLDLLAVASIRNVMGERGEDVKKKGEYIHAKEKLINSPPHLNFLMVYSFANRRHCDQLVSITEAIMISVHWIGESNKIRTMSTRLPARFRVADLYCAEHLRFLCLQSVTLAVFMSFVITEYVE